MDGAMSDHSGEGRSDRFQGAGPRTPWPARPHRGVRAAPAARCRRPTFQTARAPVSAVVWGLLAFVGAVAWASTDVSAAVLELEEAQWGFDGGVIPHRFMPLSLRLRNTTDGTVETTLRLRAALLGASAGLPPLEKSVYLEPFATRWVFFHPYVVGDAFQWRLEYEAGGKVCTLSLPAARPTKPAAVMLDAGTVASRTNRVGLVRFPEALFPASVTAMDGLRAVVLDHVPRWTSQQAAAFREWLWRGGIVHVLASPDGSALRFPRKLDVLNTAAAVTAVGGGFVHRHDQTASRVTRGDLLAWGLVQPPQKASRDQAGRATGRGGVAGAWFAANMRTGADTGIWAVIGRLHGNLRPWGRIYAIAVAYVFVLLPAVWFLRYHRRPVLAVFGGLLAAALVTSLAFRSLASPPAAESIELHYAVLARPLIGGTVDCTLWGDLLAGQQAEVRIRAPGDRQLYGVHAYNEPVDGSIGDGPGGELVLRMPPFSTRQFVTRYRIRQPVPQVRLLRVERAGNRLQSAEFLVSRDGSPSEVRLEWNRACVVHGRQMYGVGFADGRLTLRGMQGAVDSVVRRDINAEWSPPPPQKPADAQDRLERFFEGLRRSLIVRALDLPALEDVTTAAPADAVLLAVPARSAPPWLLPECSPRWTAKGCTVFVYRFAIPAP